MTHTDIKLEGWVSQLPEKWQPYALLMRLDRPIGWWLLLLPGWWGIVLGGNGFLNMYHFQWRLMILFLIGAILMRGAGCIINDLWDRDLDKQVERTKNRPLASGRIPAWKACVCLACLIYISFLILLMTSGITIGLGFLSIFLIAAYPLMKRITWWPQAFLGITFNFSSLMGWSAATHNLDLPALFLYVAAFFWTMGYDTIYAHQDKDDDELIGIKSTALLFGERSHGWVSLFYTLTMLFLALAVFWAGAGIITLTLLIIPAIHLYRQIQAWDPYDKGSSLAIFKANRSFGLLVLLSFAFAGTAQHLQALGLPIPHIGF